MRPDIGSGVIGQQGHHAGGLVVDVVAVGDPLAGIVLDQIGDDGLSG